MKRTQLLQEIRQMRFEEAYRGWTEKCFTQEEAARLLGIWDRKPTPSKMHIPCLIIDH